MFRVSLTGSPPSTCCTERSSTSPGGAIRDVGDEPPVRRDDGIDRRALLGGETPHVPQFGRRRRRKRAPGGKRSQRRRTESRRRAGSSGHAGRAPAARSRASCPESMSCSNSSTRSGRRRCSASASRAPCVERPTMRASSGGRSGVASANGGGSTSGSPPAWRPWTPSGTRGGRPASRTERRRTRRCRTDDRRPRLPRLLGDMYRHGADDGAVDRERPLGSASSIVPVASERSAPPPPPSPQAEVEHLDLAGLGSITLPGLRSRWTMPAECARQERVGDLNAVRDGLSQRQRLFPSHRPAGDPGRTPSR